MTEFLIIWLIVSCALAFGVGAWLGAGHGDKAVEDTDWQDVESLFLDKK